jgi:uncharacterized protein YbjT (DUF2867 family)
MRVILFGATGMVGQAVLRECLRDPAIETVLSVGRSSTDVNNPKLRELLRNDLFEIDTATRDALRGYDACFFCLGVSAAGMGEADYTRMTYDLTMVWARELAQLNPSMTFVYVSGTGTDGKAMWARVKKRTEDALLALFPNAYMFRLAMLKPENREVSKTRWTRVSYILFKPLIPLIRLIAPNAVITTEELGRAMIRVARESAPKHVLENREMRVLGSR